MKEFNLYMHKAPESALTTWDETEIAIVRENEIIDTTQVMLCTTSLFEQGYRIFVHFGENDKTEIKLGSNERTNRVICMGHNLPNLIVAGEFDKREESVAKMDEPVAKLEILNETQISISYDDINFLIEKKGESIYNAEGYVLRRDFDILNVAKDIVKSEKANIVFQNFCPEAHICAMGAGYFENGREMDAEVFCKWMILDYIQTKVKVLFGEYYFEVNNNNGVYAFLKALPQANFAYIKNDVFNLIDVQFDKNLNVVRAEKYYRPSAAIPFGCGFKKEILYPVNKE